MMISVVPSTHSVTCTFGPVFGRAWNGILADVAPTVLDLMGIAKPEEMTGKSLVELK